MVCRVRIDLDDRGAPGVVDGRPGFTRFDPMALGTVDPEEKLPQRRLVLVDRPGPLGRPDLLGERADPDQPWIVQTVFRQIVPVDGMHVAPNATRFRRVSLHGVLLIPVDRCSSPLRAVLPIGVPQERIPNGNSCTGHVLGNQRIGSGAKKSAVHAVVDQCHRVQPTDPPRSRGKPLPVHQIIKGIPILHLLLQFG